MPVTLERYEKSLAAPPLCEQLRIRDLLVALGHAAVDAGFRVRYFSAVELVETLYRGLADNSVGRVLEQILNAPPPPPPPEVPELPTDEKAVLTGSLRQRPYLLSGRPEQRLLDALPPIRRVL